MDNENKLFFVPSEWSFNNDCANNVGKRCLVFDIDENLVDGFTIGNWQWDWTEITTDQLLLKKNEDYTFTFFIKGGENDRNDEVCQLQILFDNDYENKEIFKLNRNYIKPYKKHNGWKLYEITFNTGNHDFTQFRFVVMGAITSIIPSEEKEKYTFLTDDIEQEPKKDKKIIIKKIVIAIGVILVILKIVSWIKKRKK